MNFFDKKYNEFTFTFSYINVNLKKRNSFECEVCMIDSMCKKI